ncbi:MAG TPA: HPr kinase/phosphorylase [Caulobacteraceae bacterium]|nr:HPr kinase/phosphorylase [Caulobacteraceae bacterium]
MILHAGLVALRLRGFWRGALILGPSGAGKSDLALRALEAGFRLVADDRVTAWTSGGKLYGRAPDPLGGLIEARGHGISAEPSLGFAQIVLAVRCVPPGEAIERMPDAATECIAQTAIPLARLDPREASAPAKLRRALLHLGHGP